MQPEYLNMYTAYILKSLKDEHFYYGHSQDLQNRLKRHNTGKVRSTKARRPFIIHYYEEFATKSEAAKREYFFKTIEGYNYLKLKQII
jgi:putative endonuclease